MKKESQTILDVAGMTCPSCVRHVDRALRNVLGVRHVEVRLHEGRALVEHAGAEEASLVRALEEAGYPAQVSQPPSRIEIDVDEDGFSPDRIRVKAGEPVTLAFTRKVDRTCAKRVAIQLGGGKTIERSLPLGETVAIEATFGQSGNLRYACPMDMITGVITVE